MSSEPCDDLPTGLAELAALVADLDQPEGRRSQALARLVPTIESNACQVATRFRRHLQEDLVGESVTVIWMRIGQYSRAAGRFEDWCRTVLYHYAVDLWRKAKSGPVRPAVGGDEPSAALELAAAVEDHSDEVIERCRELRAVLDRLAWSPPRGVNYFAVLLLHLRLVMARHLTHAPLNEDPAWRGELPDLVESLLPWSAEEAESRFKHDWPPLRQIWEGACKLLRERTLTIEVSRPCDVVERWLPASSQLTPELWNQWVHRAKDRAKHRLQDEAAWSRCFSRLLPDRCEEARHR